MSATPYRFSLGPWNIGRGADPFGPPVRPAVSFDDVLTAAVDLGFEVIQFHDDDAVPSNRARPRRTVTCARPRDERLL